MSDRIVITGTGWVTPLGCEVESVWKRLLAGDSGVSATEHFDASTFPTRFSAQVRGFDHRNHVRHPELHESVGRNIGYVLGAAAQAWKAAGLLEFDDAGELDHDQLGVYLGSGEGILDFDNYIASNLAGWNDNDRRIDAAAWAKTAYERLDPAIEIAQEPNMALNHLALEFDARGPAYNCLTACAASTQAIGEACEIIKRGGAQIMLSGGCHTMIHPLGVTGFNRLTALSTRNDDPTHASRPFSHDRDGFVMGEGAGVLVLETLEHAQQRGATILAEVAGYGSTADAYRITDIHPEGRGAAQAMNQALDQAGLTTADIDYISAHGTGTRENDSIETKAVKAVFAKDGDLSQVPPMSSIKSMMGHLIAAAGAVEAIVCILVLRDQMLPPTINLDAPDPQCDLDYVPNAARQAEVNVCLSNSFGFGGQNDALVLRKFPR